MPYFNVYQPVLTKSNQLTKRRFAADGSELKGSPVYDVTMELIGVASSTDAAAAVKTAKRKGIVNPVVEFADPDLRSSFLAKVRRECNAQDKTDRQA